jgi:hypothetical protein
LLCKSCAVSVPELCLSAIILANDGLLMKGGPSSEFNADILATSAKLMAKPRKSVPLLTEKTYILGF